MDGPNSHTVMQSGSAFHNGSRPSYYYSSY